MTEDRTGRPGDDDRQVREALRELEPDVPAERVDWDALQARVEHAAADRLARRRARDGASWWRSAARWARAGVPLAAAAAALLAVGLARTPSPAPATGPIGDRLAEAPPAATGEAGLEAILAGADPGDVLLLDALDEE